MQAGLVSFLEQKAYDVAVRDECIEPRDIDRISMTELFDMISGSETGAIIATSLVIPQDDDPTKNKYFSTEAVKFFNKNLDILYKDK